MTLLKIFGAVAVSLLLTVSSAPVLASSATTSQASAEDIEKAAKAFMDTLHPVHGIVSIPEAQADLQLGDHYYFLNKEDARKVIVDAWGNPPESADDVLGMVVPEGRTPLNDWAAVVTYAKTDYVSDKDAEKADYDKMLKDGQSGEAEENEARKKAGYEATHLVGWAQPPSYDRANHTMIWARDIKFGLSTTDTLNYDVRLLGRSGVLSLNMVATMPELASIREQAKQLAASGQFQAGSRYQDYKSGDPKAAYGVAGLVAAGLGLAAAKKLGLLALILVFAKKGFVIILAVLAGVGRWVSRIFGGKKKAAPRPPSAFDEQPPEPQNPEMQEEVSQVAQPQTPTVEDDTRRRD